jgi:hypothetical protein
MKKLVYICIVMFIIWLLNLSAISDWDIQAFLINFSTFDFAKRGQIGDSFGAINALFSGLAFAGVIYTIILQREELSAQSKEFKQQKKTLIYQRFENTFFNLVTLHHKIVDSIHLEFNEIKMEAGIAHGYFEKKGRDFFKFTFEELKDNHVQLNKYNYEEINTAYKLYYEVHKTNLGHYFRNLYRIVKFIDETSFYKSEECGTQQECNDKNFEERYNYVSMIRAQLSDYELGWIFYNCACEFGRDKFLPLVNKYKFLKNLATKSDTGEYIINIELMLDKYEPTAFGLTRVEFDKIKKSITPYNEVITV